MLVYFALGDAKVWRWGSKPTPGPNANGFASKWNIGFKYTFINPMPVSCHWKENLMICLTMHTLENMYLSFENGENEFSMEYNLCLKGGREGAGIRLAFSPTGAQELY